MKTADRLRQIKTEHLAKIEAERPEQERQAAEAAARYRAEGIKRANDEWPRHLKEMEQDCKWRTTYSIHVCSLDGAASHSERTRGIRDRFIELLTEEGFEFKIDEHQGGTSSTAWTSAFYCTINISW
jgi:hypothetical protein